MLEPDQLKSLVNDQLIVGFACLTPKGKIHRTTVWIATYCKELFIYSKDKRKKIQYLKKNNNCTIIFNNGTVTGEAEIVPKTDKRFMKNYNYLDPRYSHDSNLETYKKNWNVMVVIKPKKVY